MPYGEFVEYPGIVINKHLLIFTMLDDVIRQGQSLTASEAHVSG